MRPAWSGSGGTWIHDMDRFFDLPSIRMPSLMMSKVRSMLAMPETVSSYAMRSSGRKTAKAACLMTDSPSTVDSKQLDELGIDIAESEE